MRPITTVTAVKTPNMRRLDFLESSIGAEELWMAGMN
jgi:hypothetical protein